MRKGVRIILAVVVLILAITFALLYAGRIGEATQWSGGAESARWNIIPAKEYKRWMKMSPEKFEEEVMKTDYSVGVAAVFGYPSSDGARRAATMEDFVDNHPLRASTLAMAVHWVLSAVPGATCCIGAEEDLVDLTAGEFGRPVTGLVFKIPRGSDFLLKKWAFGPGNTETMWNILFVTMASAFGAGNPTDDFPWAIEPYVLTTPYHASDFCRQPGSEVTIDKTEPRPSVQFWPGHSTRLSQTFLDEGLAAAVPEEYLSHLDSTLTENKNNN